MSRPPRAVRLVVSDVDGTRVGSPDDILMAMHHAFAPAGPALPERDGILGVVWGRRACRLTPEAAILENMCALPGGGSVS